MPGLRRSTRSTEAIDPPTTAPGAVAGGCMGRLIPRAQFRVRNLNENAMTKCYDLTPEQLTDSPLARLAVDVGHPSLTALLNANGWWGLTVDEVVDLLSDSVVI